MHVDEPSFSIRLTQEDTPFLGIKHGVPNGMRCSVFCFVTLSLSLSLPALFLNACQGSTHHARGHCKENSDRTAAKRKPNSADSAK
jgi:hypothetical protein